MALWELEELQPPATLGFVRNLLPVPAYQGGNYLPEVNVDDVEFEYLMAARETPVMATVISWDAESPIGSRPAQGEKIQGEMAPMKRKERISEKEILRFLQPRRGTNDENRAVAAVYDRMARLTRSIQARTEWLQMQALSEPKLVYSEDGVVIEFDYGIPPTQRINLVSGTDGAGTDVSALFGPSWNDHANATPFSDLQAIARIQENATGTRPKRMVLSRKHWDNLPFSTQLKGLIYQQNAPDRPLDPAEINALMTRYDLPTFITYDVKVKQEAANGTTTEVRTMDENRAFLLPDSNVGQTLVGPTAESRVLLGTPYAQVASGIWAATYPKDEPPSEWVKVAKVAFPTMPDAHMVSQFQLA
jgi:hypothetical protein